MLYNLHTCDNAECVRPSVNRTIHASRTQMRAQIQPRAATFAYRIPLENHLPIRSAIQKQAF